MPSTRFRWTQYLADIHEAGLKVVEFTARHDAYPPPSVWQRPSWLLQALADSAARVMRARDADVRFLQRNLIATLCTWEPLLGRPFVFDVDDAIFLGARGASANRIARCASLTICGNQFLANHFGAFGPVEILPTAVDTDRFVPATAASIRRPVIGWSGTSSGFPYLYGIEPALRRVLDRYPDAVVKVVADRAPRLDELPASRVVFERWQPDTEVASLQGFTIGIMPLEDNPWARGKCSFKMLTYMAAALPVVVSPVGMNMEVLSRAACGYGARSVDDWVDALSTLLDDPSLGTQFGRDGRRVVEAHYSRKVIGPRLARLLLAQI